MRRRRVAVSASGALHTIRGPNVGTGTSSGYPAVDEPKHQSRRFIARQHPSHLFRRDRRHQFGTQFEPLTEGNTGSEAPEHGGHARLIHRGRFYDDDTGHWLASMAEGQQEVGHARVRRCVGQSTGRESAY